MKLLCTSCKFYANASGKDLCHREATTEVSLVDGNSVITKTLDPHAERTGHARYGFCGVHARFFVHKDRELR